MYILLCEDGSYYTGSTINLERRMEQHFSGNGANHTKKHRPIKLLYYEEYGNIADAFYREKQVQRWSRIKKEALINEQHELLPELAKNYTQYGPLYERLDISAVASTGSATVEASSATAITGSATASPDEESIIVLAELAEANTILVEGTDTTK